MICFITGYIYEMGGGGGAAQTGGVICLSVQSLTGDLIPRAEVSLGHLACSVFPDLEIKRTETCVLHAQKMIDSFHGSRGGLSDRFQPETQTPARKQ